MNSAMLYAAAAVLALTAVLHAVLGEKRLITPMLVGGAGVLSQPLARAVVRFAWHFTSVLMLLVALVQYRGAAVPGAADLLVLRAIGGSLLAVGLFDAVMSRLKHVGWPFLAVSGLLTLLAI